MSDPRTHPLEALHDAIDDRLDMAARVALDAHLASCASCRREFELLSGLKHQLRAAPTTDEMTPPDLEQRLRQALDEEDRRLASPATADQVGGRRAWWLGWAAAAAAVLVFTILWGNFRPAPESAPAEVAADFRRFATGTLPLEVVTGDVRTLEQRLTGAGLGFDTRVFDFGMMDFRLAGGGRHRVSARPSALFAYTGPEALTLLCQMYLGQVSTLPPPTERRTNDGIDFLVYREGDVTVVFWQEGDVVCALAANGDPDAAVKLAFAKAVRG